jgi:hypothetical protein
MKIMILAALAALGLGMAVVDAQAATRGASSTQQGDQYNYMRGGGG